MKTFTPSKRAYGNLLRLLTPTLNDRAEKIAAACNAESSWGFYKADPDESFKGGWVGESLPSPRVYALNAKADDARGNRLLRNLEAGRL